MLIRTALYLLEAGENHIFRQEEQFMDENVTFLDSESVPLVLKKCIIDYYIACGKIFTTRHLPELQ